MWGDLWRVVVALCDWRGWLRMLTGQPLLDVVFISNLRDEAERQRFFGRRRPRSGHANGARVYLNGVAGRIRGIDVTAEEMLTKEGRRLAQAHFIAACEWAERKGARVVLLAASTKRLFGRDGAQLKARFPNLHFTIGDNGTAQMLWADVCRGLQSAGLSQRGRVLVVGPYGILGECMTRQLVHAGYEVVGYGGNASALAETALKYRIAVNTDVAAVGKVDAVVACTHSSAAKLNADGVASLRRLGRKLLVIDVAEPANLDVDVYAEVQRDVIRQDAGNAFSRRLHYVLGPLSWRMLMLSRGVVFGCFAEAMALYHAIYLQRQGALRQVDWFVVDDVRMARVANAFAEAGFALPAPRCFGQAVDDFDLRLVQA
ncbi:hypothetical protein SAMN02745857_03009 [Andreprevotia lacus DSM 23236]|jgi:predicted amino acid dehydrogenase|uniref:Pyrroline-5-carboxylate reductase catalytic N-terminal domain-containing protein n=1 Tax=Andreprevotia lacus DSM 23236 TaxID=1121001 RepID=A0A1W1XVL4_9NEIS|nr:NAD(P)-binding domain-containing protein [Andreprevotia lacus]SMC27884.1 hypothetical protein SAMN02745857_03009 [Andreprevotia lacus DSM 23236]